MMQKNLSITDLYFDQRMAGFLDMLDQIHSAASEDGLGSVTTFSQNEVNEWLREVAYLAQETLNELDPGRENGLHMVEARQSVDDSERGFSRQKGHSA